jgi:hypothetical protein
MPFRIRTGGYSVYTSSSVDPKEMGAERRADVLGWIGLILDRVGNGRPGRGSFLVSPRRFPPPWSVEETDACFIVRNADGQALAYTKSQRQTETHRPWPWGL